MNKTDFKYISAIFLIAIIARWGFHFAVYEPFADRFNWAHYPGQFNLYSDDNYDEIARSLLAGKGFSRSGEYPNLSRTPVYPIILAGQFFLFGDGYWANLAINIIYQSLVCIVLYILTLNMFRQRNLALLSGTIWALYPLPMLQAMGPNTEPVYELFLVFFVYFLHRFFSLRDTKSIIYTSIFLLLVTLTRPISILYPVYFAALIMLIMKGSFRNRLIHIALLVAIFALGIAPWMYRGYTITGRVIPLVSYRVFEDDKTGDSSKMSIEEKKGFVGRFSDEIRNPLSFIANTSKRLVRFWYYGHSTPVRAVNAVLQFPLLGLSILGIWLARRQKVLIVPILSTVAYFWMAYAATHAISRYSFPMVALLCPFAALGLSKVLPFRSGFIMGTAGNLATN